MNYRFSGALLVFAAFATIGCAKREEPQTTAPVVDAGPKVKPADHLAPGELVEGNQKVFGLAIPRDMFIERSFDDVAFVSGPVTPEAVSKYLEARVRDGTVKTTAEGHVFDKVSPVGDHEARHAKGETKLLRIVVSKDPSGSGTRMQLRDVTPPQVVDTAKSDEERWRAVGLKPNGEPLDRTKLR